MKLIQPLLLTIALPLLYACTQKVKFTIDKEYGYLSHLAIEGDERAMNWLMETDGTQYSWVDQQYGWGLGEFTQQRNGEKQLMRWRNPVEVTEQGSATISRYQAGDIEIKVTRRLDRGDLVERYEFTNQGEQDAQLEEVAINTPFNDNYPDAETCYQSRTNAHIWPGMEKAYVNAMHMSGKAPHLGLVLTEGSITQYEICERGNDKASSNTRGVIRLLTRIDLRAKESKAVAWKIFVHNGQEDFYQNLLNHGSIVGKSNKYLYEVGDTARVEFLYKGTLGGYREVTLNGRVIASRNEKGCIVVEYPITAQGEHRFELRHEDELQSTQVVCLAISSAAQLISKRAHFIIDRQQYNNPDDLRDGAYLVYDNEKKEIYLNDSSAGKRADCDEGRERIGMGVLLALHYQQTKEEKIKESLLRYADFVRRLQREDYVTFSTVDHNSKDRAYNYPWLASFYFEMFHVTGDKEFLTHGYQTLKAMYRQHGHTFYAIDVPVKGYYILKENGFEEEAESILADFKENADAYVANGWNYPKSEVNYEQSIVAPSIIHLLRVYQVTGEAKYLESAQEQMPLLEAFAGFQPSYQMNEIAIRHWDGYWFGKYRLWGDNYPHYWSTLSAIAYSLYSEATGDSSYQQRAENIVRNNLCQFFEKADEVISKDHHVARNYHTEHFEEGSASCAFIYPCKVDGRKGYFYDPYANDQDWALVYYLMVHNEGLNFSLSRL